MVQRKEKSENRSGEFRTIRDAKGRAEFVLVPAKIFKVIQPRLNAILEDPFYRKLASAPLDDEPETQDEARAVRQARRAYKRGETVSHDEILQR